MAPRGIVAGASASAFALQLTQQGIAGADKILPVVFVAIFATVVLYGLTAAPVARRLGVAGAEGMVALVVGGHDWALEVASALRRAGAGVRVWTGDAGEQAAAKAAGLEADRGRMMVDAVNREAELEEVTDALLLTRSDDFNALAAAQLRIELGHQHVQRLAPDPQAPLLVPPLHEGGLLPSYAEMSRRFDDGAQIVAEVEHGDYRAVLRPCGRDPDAGTPRRPRSTARIGLAGIACRSRFGRISGQSFSAVLGGPDVRGRSGEAVVVARMSVRNWVSSACSAVSCASTGSSRSRRRRWPAAWTNALVTAAVVTASRLSPASITSAAVRRPGTEPGTTSP